MSLGNVSVFRPGGEHFPPAMGFRTEANTTVINAGEPCAIGGTGTNYVVPVADNAPLTSSASFAGIAASTSNQTASADGVVQVLVPVPGVIYQCRAKTASTFDTDAEILAVLNDNVVFDLTGGVYTIDVAAASAGGTGALRIVGGDPVTQIVYFIFKMSGTFLN